MFRYKKLIILIALSIIVVRLGYVCGIQNACGDPRLLLGIPKVDFHPSPTPLMTSMGTLSLTEDGRPVLSDYSQLSFASHTANPAWTQNNIDFLRKTADYIVADADRSLTVTGYYLSSEVADTPAGFTDLGIARAAIVKDTLFQLGVTADRVTLTSSVLDDVTLSKSTSFIVHIDKKDIPRTYMIQK
ncbi:MAG: hypothetical protein WCO78_04935 [Candidatus Roizmanbacteria bacterium]